MKTNSNAILPEFETRGLYMFVNFNEEIIPATAEESETFTYDTAKFSKSATRAERIEAIIATKYHTYGSELAAINNTDEDAKTEYLAFREQAKTLATRSFLEV